MRTGRPRVSADLHALAGTKVHPSEAKPLPEGETPAGRPRMPAHVRADPVAAGTFRDAVRILKRRRTLSAGDSVTLAVFAVVYSKWVFATEDIRTRGFEIEVTRTNKQGEEYQTTIPNLSVKVACDCERQLLQLGKALGLTPDTREKVRPTKGTSRPAKWVPIPGSAGERYRNLFDENGKLHVI